MPTYHEAFRSGENVRIADETTLRAFQRTWIYHHPLEEHQIIYANSMCYVQQVSFYHGGECLYELGTWVLDNPDDKLSKFPASHQEKVPGYWHEACLTDWTADAWEAQQPLAREVYKVTAEIRYGQPVVVVKTQTGIECLVARYQRNEYEASKMNEVASMRKALEFERRYSFEGIMEDALGVRYSQS